MTDKTLENLVLPEGGLASAELIKTIAGVGLTPAETLRDRFAQHHPLLELLSANQPSAWREAGSDLQPTPFIEG